MLTRLLTYLRTAIAWLQPKRVVTTTTIDGKRIRLIAWVFRGRVFLGRVAPAPLTDGAEDEKDDVAGWHRVEVVADTSTEFGVASDEVGVLTVVVRRPGEPWPHGVEPQSGLNAIELGFTRYVVIANPSELPEIDALYERRAAHLKDARAVWAGAEGRGLTADEKHTLNHHLRESERLFSQIKAHDYPATAVKGEGG